MKFSKWIAMLSAAVMALCVSAVAQVPNAQGCSGGCEPASRHKLAMCTFSDGMGGSTTGTNLDVGGLVAGLQSTCATFAAAHTNSSQTTTFLVCTPNPTLGFNYSGGNSGAFAIDGVARVTYSNGTSQDAPGPWNTGSCTCADQINVNNAKMGTDGQCYCPLGYSWHDGLQGCVRFGDRFHFIDQPRQCVNVKGGNPIYPLTGSKRQDESIPLGAGFDSLKINYDTVLNLPTSDGAAAFSPYRVRYIAGLWSTSMHRKLVMQFNASVQTAAVQADRGANRWISFSRNSNGTYSPMSGVADTLIRTAAGWRYTDAETGTQEVYDAAGTLLQAVTAAGANYTFVYSTTSTPVSIAPSAGLLIAVQDSFGRSVQFNYVQPTARGSFPRLTKVIDTAGRTTTLNYTGTNLTGLTWPDGMGRQYLYELANLPWAMTGVIDELSNRLSTYGYNAAGLAVSTELAGSQDQYSATWGVEPRWSVVTSFDQSNGILWRDHYLTLPQDVVMRLPNLADIHFGTTLINGNPRVTSRDQPAGAGCNASTSSSAFDANGNVASKDDFVGTRTCYVNDLSRNLQTARVEGLANTVTCDGVTPVGAALPAGSRKTSTQWHPDWLLQSKVAEPGRLTTSVYNGQPDPFNANAIASCAPAGAVLPDGKPIAVLCKQVEQATTDVNGGQGFAAALEAGVPNRVRSWTYDQYGHVLTQVDPLGHTTTYAYYGTTSPGNYTMGDLASVTNALGQVTNFAQYNANGQVLTTTDPNGVATVNTYDLRQRLLSTTVGGQTTGYTYDSAGQLTRITRPDSSYVGYEYDAAHRLNAIVDNLGNRIEYTLDNAGNRTAEQVKDPSGTLRRSLARSIDALGRVQQTTGRE